MGFQIKVTLNQDSSRTMRFPLSDLATEYSVISTRFQIYSLAYFLALFFHTASSKSPRFFLQSTPEPSQVQNSVTIRRV